MAGTQSDVESICASSMNTIKVEGIGREVRFSTQPSWTCVTCKKGIHTCPVYQCHKGHLECSSCYASGKYCRGCSKDVRRMRNFAVEELMRSMEMTCKFASLGCKKIGKFTEHEAWTEHEKSCLFAPRVCPMPECVKEGAKAGFSDHLLKEHKISTVVDLEV